MSLTDNYIVPDFFYTESGMPALCPTTEPATIGGCHWRTTADADGQTRTTRSFKPLCDKPSSFLPSTSSSSTSTSPLALFKPSLSSKSHNYSNVNSIRDTNTKSTATTTTSNNHSPNTNTFASSIHNNCDRSRNQIHNSKYEKPKKLLQKRATIYQSEPSAAAAAGTAAKPVDLEEQNTTTTAIALRNNSTTIPNRLDEIDRDDSYCRDSSLNFCNAFKSIESDKERKTYVNNRIKQLQNRQTAVGGRSPSYQNQLLLQQQQQQQQLLSDYLNCPKIEPIAVDELRCEKFPHHNGIRNRQAVLDNRITYYDGQKLNNKSCTNNTTTTTTTGKECHNPIHMNCAGNRFGGDSVNKIFETDSNGSVVRDDDDVVRFNSINKDDDYDYDFLDDFFRHIIVDSDEDEYDDDDLNDF